MYIYKTNLSIFIFYFLLLIQKSLLNREILTARLKM